MKKTLRLMPLAMIMVMAAGLISCSDDDSGNDSLNGWYAAYLPAKGSSDYTGQAYHFINSNTVEYYPTISGSPRWTGYFSSEELPAPMDGYYIQAGNVQNYTYELIDNKIIIPMRGTILTISGNDLLPDGGGRFTKLQ